MSAAGTTAAIAEANERTKLVLQRLDLALRLDGLKLGGERVEVIGCATAAQHMSHRIPCSLRITTVETLKR